MLGVLFGGPSPEHDISILTGLLALRELNTSHDDVVGLYWTKAGAFVMIPNNVEAESFVDGSPKGSTELDVRLGATPGFYVVGGRLGRDRHLSLDAIVVATHGGPGEDGTLQGLLDSMNIPYTGPHVAGAALGMDKWAFGAAVCAAELPSLPRVLLTEETTDLPFPGPYILKPRFGGSSIGIDVVADLPTARARLRTNTHFERGCVVEPYRPDLSDIQVAVRSFPQLQLSAIERPIRSSENREILDYRDKYVGGEGMVSAPRELPAQLSSARADEIRMLTKKVAEIAMLRGVARIDFLMNDSELYVNEINTIPGSLSKHLFIEPPVSFSSLLGDLVAEATAHPARRYSTAGADGLVLRSAQSIASKLA